MIGKNWEGGRNEMNENEKSATKNEKNMTLQKEKEKNKNVREKRKEEQSHTRLGADGGWDGRKMHPRGPGPRKRGHKARGPGGLTSPLRLAHGRDESYD